MLESEVSTSGGTFLFSLTYWSNSAGRRAHEHLDSRARQVGPFLHRREPAPRRSPRLSASIRLMSTRWPPSTRTLTVPSGSFSSCRILARVPTSYMSPISGSSTSARLCATSRICWFCWVAWSSALIDFSRPHEQGDHHVRIDHHVAQRQHRESLAEKSTWVLLGLDCSAMVVYLGGSDGRMRTEPALNCDPICGSRRGRFQGRRPRLIRTDRTGCPEHDAPHAREEINLMRPPLTAPRPRK